MGPATAIKTCLTKSVQFKCRASRSEFWWLRSVTVLSGSLCLLLGCQTTSTPVEASSPSDANSDGYADPAISIDRFVKNTNPDAIVAMSYADREGWGLRRGIFTVAYDPRVTEKDELLKRRPDYWPIVDLCNENDMAFEGVIDVKPPESAQLNPGLSVFEIQCGFLL